MASAGGLHGGPTLARVGKGGVIMLAIFMALQELGVATEIVTTAFAILFGAIALALSLSFGLGNRELAGEVTRDWYRRYREERDSIERDNREIDRAEGMSVTEDYVRPVYPTQREVPVTPPPIPRTGPDDVVRVSAPDDVLQPSE
jgi:hypothetical protein